MKPSKPPPEGDGVGVWGGIKLSSLTDLSIGVGDPAKSNQYGLWCCLQGFLNGLSWVLAEHRPRRECHIRGLGKAPPRSHQAPHQSPTGAVMIQEIFLLIRFSCAGKFVWIAYDVSFPAQQWIHFEEKQSINRYFSNQKNYRNIFIRY